MLLLDPKALSASAPGCSDHQQQRYRDMQHLIRQTTSLTLSGRLVASLCEENLLAYLLLKVLHFFFNLIISSLLHTTSFHLLQWQQSPPLPIHLSIFSSVYLVQTEHIFTKLTCRVSVMLPTMGTSLLICLQENATSAIQVMFDRLHSMFIWLMSMRSSGTNPPYQATAGCLAEDIWPITLGPAFIRTIKCLGLRWSTSEKEMVWVSALHSHAF